MLKRLLLIVFVLIPLFTVACGTIATPESDGDAHTDEVNQNDESHDADTDTEPTEVVVVPTNTPEPPTAEPTQAPTNTPEPPPATPTEEVAESTGPSRTARLIQVADPVNGETIFNTMYGEVGFACATCHTVAEGAADGLGPNQWNLFERAGERVEGLGAEDYVYESIINPHDYIVEGFNEGLMPQIYGDLLTPQEIFDVANYLLSLGNE